MQKTITSYLIILFFLNATLTLQAQNVAIGSGSVTPDISAVLDLVSGDKGLSVPNISLTFTNIAFPVSLPKQGLLVYNINSTTGAASVSPGFYYWQQDGWQSLANQTQTLSNNGLDGNIILFGAGTNVPTMAHGQPGDFFVRTVGEEVLLFGPKTSVGWPTTGVSLNGPTGPAGTFTTISPAAIISSAVPPSAFTGTTGDFYLHIQQGVTNTLNLYGPKSTNNTWDGSTPLDPQAQHSPVNAWGLFGSGLTNSTHYIGTSDAAPLIFKTNSQTRLVVSSSTAAIKIGNGNQGAHPSAILEVIGNNQGVSIPNVALVNLNISSPITDPKKGLLVYNTNTNFIAQVFPGFYYWDGTKWAAILKSSSMGSNGPKGIQGSSVFSDFAMQPNIGREGDFFIDLTDKILYGPKTNPVSWVGSNTIALVGAVGKDGKDGLNGKTILNGLGAPAVGIATDGDFYIDRQNHMMYGPKTNNNWGLGYSIAVLNTPLAKTILSGTSTPDNSKGLVGDFWLNTTTYELTGPKLNNTTWFGAVLTKLKGDKGDSGTNGTAILSFITSPPSGISNIGNDGDYWLQSFGAAPNHTAVLYGPKTNSVWPSVGTSIRGNDGPQGFTGNAFGYATQTLVSGSRDGDYFLNTDTYVLTGPRTNSVWTDPATQTLSLIGAKGPKGAVVYMGTLAPTASTPSMAVPNDYYVYIIKNNGSNTLPLIDAILYGPKKANNTWPSVGYSLIGLKGQRGSAIHSGTLTDITALNNANVGLDNDYYLQIIPTAQAGTLVNLIGPKTAGNWNGAFTKSLQGAKGATGNVGTNGNGFFGGVISPSTGAASNFTHIPIGSYYLEFLNGKAYLNGPRTATTSLNLTGFAGTPRVLLEGSKGKDSQAGNTIYFDNASPSVVANTTMIPKNNDYYLDTYNYILYGPHVGNVFTAASFSEAATATLLAQPAKTILSGSNTPTDAVGNEGDLYLQQTPTDAIMHGAKTATGWATSAKKSLRGAAGITILSGIIPPSLEGNNGDFYYNTNTNILYGPKRDNMWVVTNTLQIKGTTGDVGDASDSPTLAIMGTNTVPTAAVGGTMAGFFHTNSSGFILSGPKTSTTNANPSGWAITNTASPVSTQTYYIGPVPTRTTTIPPTSANANVTNTIDLWQIVNTGDPNNKTANHIRLNLYANKAQRTNAATSFAVYDNGNVAIGQDKPNAAAILDAQSTTKAFILTRLTTNQRNSLLNPAMGLQVYDTNLKDIYMFDGNNWRTLASIPPETFIPYNQYPSFDATPPYLINGALWVGYDDVSKKWRYTKQASGRGLTDPGNPRTWTNTATDGEFNTNIDNLPSGTHCNFKYVPNTPAKQYNQDDIAVRVGSSWIDKYANIIIDVSNNTKQSETSGNPFVADPANDQMSGNGQGLSKSWMAFSQRSYCSRSISWHAAKALAANAGKLLISDPDWQVAAAGTLRSNSNGAHPFNSWPTVPDQDVSRYGMVGMAGSNPEMVDYEGQFGPDVLDIAGSQTMGSSSSSYGGDGTWNIATKAITLNTSLRDAEGYKKGAIGAMRRGGQSGIFEINGIFTSTTLHYSASFRSSRR